MSLEQFDISHKILFHQDCLNKWIKGKLNYPINIEIDPTNVCNERCVWCCWEEHRGDKETMDKALLIKTINDLANVGVKAINWTGGGEPLVNPHTPEAIQLAKERGIKNGVFTNGILMFPKIHKTLADCCTWVRISLGAATPETFEKCHGIDQKFFHQILSNVNELARFKKESNSELTLGISMLVTKENYHELYQVAKNAKELGTDYFQGKPLLQSPPEDANWWNSKVIPEFEMAKKDFEKDGFKVLVAQYTKDKYGIEGVNFRDAVKDSKEISSSESSNCHVHNFVTAITANGDVAFCKNLRDQKKFHIGNLKNNSFREIWNSQRKKDAEREINCSGCKTFCQNGELNRLLQYLKLKDSLPSVIEQKKPLHPEFL